MPKKILVVDDTQATNKTLCSYLQTKGYETFSARNGFEGYEIFREELPDLIITDILMPKMNGMDMMKKIRGRHDGRDVPIIITTSIEKSLKLKSDAMNKYGANAYLQKPFEPALLIEHVKKLLNEEPEIKPVEVIEEKPRIQGTFQEKSYGKLFHMLHKKKATGVLKIRDIEQAINIFFDHGRPVDVRSNFIQGESLVNILKENYTLQEEQINHSRLLMEEKGLMQGQALVELGAITKEQLQSALIHQANEKMLIPFGWSESEYIFFEGDLIHDPEMTLNILPARVVLNGITRYYELAKIKRSFENKLEKPYRFDQASPYSVDDFGLSEVEMQMFRLALSCKKLSDVIEKSPVEEKRTYQILYTIFFLGIFRFGK